MQDEFENPLGFSLNGVRGTVSGHRDVNSVVGGVDIYSEPVGSEQRGEAAGKSMLYTTNNETLALCLSVSKPKPE